MAVTAAEIWSEWQAQSAAMGQVVTATEVVPGTGSLTLRGFSTSYSDGEVSTVGRLDEIVMTENADGTVSITMSDVYALTITFVPETGIPPVNLGMNLIAPDLTLTASGEPGARVYDYSASRITIEDGPISGGNGEPPVIDILIGLQDFAATYQIDDTNPDNIAYSSTSSIGGIAGAIDITPPPTEQGHLKFSFSVGASTASGGGRLGNFPLLAANPDLVPTDFSLNGTLSYDRISYDLTFQHPREAFMFFYENDGGSIDATFSDTEIDYTLAATGASGRIHVPSEMPFPVEASVGSAEIAFRIPVAAGDAPQPMSARLAYQDVEVSPALWNMIDPGQAIPRDPVTIIADLSGTLQVLTNILAMDPDEMAAPPAELRELTLNELRIGVAGAQLSGSGDLDFAPGQIVPMPVGQVDLQLSGGNALLDTLQNSGLVPIEQLAMVRGMLGAFARPGATPDTLESTIQFTEGGGITANGVPLQ